MKHKAYPKVIIIIYYPTFSYFLKLLSNLKNYLFESGYKYALYITNGS